MSKYFNEFRKAPTLEVLKIKITQMEDDFLKVSVVENLKEAKDLKDAKDLKVEEEEVEELVNR